LKLKKELPSLGLKQNLASSLLLPLLGECYKFYEPGYVNTYIGDKNLPKYDRYHLFVLIKNSLLSIENSNKIRESPRYVSDYTVINDHYSMFIFYIPEEHHSAFDLFLVGKYLLQKTRCHIKNTSGQIVFNTCKRQPKSLSFSLLFKVREKIKDLFNCFLLEMKLSVF